MHQKVNFQESQLSHKEWQRKIPTNCYYCKTNIWHFTLLTNSLWNLISAHKYLTLMVTVWLAEGLRWGRRAPHMGILLISSIGVPNHFLLVGRGGGIYLGVFRPGLWGLNSHFSFLLLKQKYIETFYFHFSLTFINKPVYLLVFAVSPGWTLLLEKLLPLTASSLTHSRTQCPPKHSSLQAPSLNCRRLARQVFPLKSHALSQQALFIHVLHRYLVP